MNADLPPVLLVDLDDTLLVSSPNGVPAWHEVCARHAADTGFEPGVLFEVIETERQWYWSDPERHRIGRNDLTAARRGYVATALEKAGRPNPDAAVAIADDYERLMHERLRPVPGAVEAVAALRDRGIRMAMITNGAAEVQRAKVERFDLARWFEHVFIEGEVGVGKPDERIYHRALDAMGAAPADTWMVGDNFEWEVAAPQRLGINGVWVDWRGRGVPATASMEPFRVVRTFAELVL